MLAVIYTCVPLPLQIGPESRFIFYAACPTEVAAERSNFPDIFVAGLQLQCDSDISSAVGIAPIYPQAKIQSGGWPYPYIRIIHAQLAN